MDSSYEHTQKGGWAYYFVGAMSVLTVVVFLVIMAIAPRESADDKSGHILIAVVGILACGPMFWATMLMSSLTVKIEGDYLVLVFGKGAFRKRFRLNEIVSAKAVKNTFSQGWGIHMCKGGWLYNVAGLDGVEIAMVSGKTNRVGTDDPWGLATAIMEATGSVKDQA